MIAKWIESSFFRPLDFESRKSTEESDHHSFAPNLAAELITPLSSMFQIITQRDTKSP